MPSRRHCGVTWLICIRDVAHSQVWHNSRVSAYSVASHESCHACEWVASHLHMSHVTLTNQSYLPSNEACHTHKWVTLHTHKWVMSHLSAFRAQAQIWGWGVGKVVWGGRVGKRCRCAHMYHITLTIESYHTYEWIMSLLRMSHVAHANASHVTPLHPQVLRANLTRECRRAYTHNVTLTNKSCHSYK